MHEPTTHSAAKNRQDLVGLRMLMERYIDGDERAFAKLHARLAPRVRARLSRLVRDPALVEDLLQLTFMRAHQARDRFEAQPADGDRSVENWYLAIARNVALDHLRERYRRERRHATLIARGDVAGMGAPEAAPTVEERALAREAAYATALEVRRAVDQLPAGQREVVRLHKLEGLSMAAVAERLDVRQGAVRVRAHRAYKALASLLLGRGDDLELAPT